VTSTLWTLIKATLQLFPECEEVYQTREKAMDYETTLNKLQTKETKFNDRRKFACSILPRLIDLQPFTVDDYKKLPPPTYYTFFITIKSTNGSSLEIYWDEKTRKQHLFGWITHSLRSKIHKCSLSFSTRLFSSTSDVQDTLQIYGSKEVIFHDLKPRNKLTP